MLEIIEVNLDLALSAKSESMLIYVNLDLQVLTVLMRESREWCELSSSNSLALLEALPLRPDGLLAVRPAIASCSRMAGTKRDKIHKSKHLELDFIKSGLSRFPIMSN